MPPNPNLPQGWRWVALTDVARMESGHTPSRRHPEYWGGDIPWIGIKDAKAHHGRAIQDTNEHTNQLGLKNSSARLLPSGTVCLSRTASVGYVTVMGRPMATSQDFVNWVCGDELLPEYLKYLFLAEKGALLRFASGAVHQTIYYPEAKALHICMPSVPEQNRIVAILDEAFAAIVTATANAEKNLANGRELFDSFLEAAFVSTKDGAKTPLAELCHADRVITYGVIKLGKEKPDGVPCLRTSNVRRLRIDTEGIKRIESALSAQFKRTILRGGEVLVNVRGTLGGVAVVSDSMSGWNVSREVAVVPVSQDLISSEYLAYCIATRANQNWLTGVLKGVAYTGINIRDLRMLPIAAPPRAQQLKLVKHLDQVQLLAQTLQFQYLGRLNLLAELKQSILHEAFAGKLTAGPNVADHALTEASV